MKLKINELHPNIDNPRLIKNDKFKKLVKSIKDFPQMLDLRPIVIDENNIILGGNMRYKACVEAGLTEIPVKIAKGLTEEQKQEFIIKDNVGFGEWEWEILSNDWNSVQLTEWGLDIWENLDDKELEPGFIDDDIIPEVKESKVKRGDIWQLGKHRIMCGDSTNADDVAKLMNRETPQLIFTDPPYGMNAVSKSGVLSAKYKNDILGDNNIDVAKDSFNLIYNLYNCKQVWFGANYYSEILPSAEGWLVWDKNNGGSDQTDCELAFTNFRSVCRLYKQASEKKNRVHPTQKPVDLFIWVVNKYNVNFDIVLDVFLGSGSTLIGAEKLNKKCYGMELDENYCDVIIERWEQFTGQKAIKINGQK